MIDIRKVAAQAAEIERERIVRMLQAYRSDDGFTNADGDTVWVPAGDSNGIGRAIDLIKGENE